LRNIITNIRNRVFHKLAFFLPGGHNFRPWLHRMRGAKIGKGVWISQYVYIDELHPEAVTIGDNCTLGLRVSIFTHFYWGSRKAEGGFKEVVIGNNVYIGPHSVILLGVKVGDGAVVKAGSVVTRDVPPNTLWGPPPSAPIGRITVPLNSEHGYEGFMKGLKPIGKARNT
jgi:acetyltransferase-like isoleucine patch superfamily enzyme